MRLIDRRLRVGRTGRWQWYWGLLGLVTVPAVTIGILALIASLVAFWPTIGALTGLDVSNDVFLSRGRWDSYAAFIVGSLPVIVATAVTIKWVHGWSVGQVLGPGQRFVWADFAKSATALFIIYAISTAMDFVVQPAQYALQVQDWGIAFWIVLAGIVILPQAFSEDFLFNGYLSRLWGAVVPVRFVVPVALSVLFSLAHAGNADVGNDPWAAHIGLFGGQLLALLIYIRTGSLGATVGLHWMNNTFSAGFVGTLPGYQNDLALMIYRDPALAAGGSNLFDFWSWVDLIAGLLLVWLSVSWRRSPFYIPDRTDIPAEIERSEARTGIMDDEVSAQVRDAT
jgi:membrane protease YdiL (CAAX protease family)